MSAKKILHPHRPFAGKFKKNIILAFKGFWGKYSANSTNLIFYHISAHCELLVYCWAIFCKFESGVMDRPFERTSKWPIWWSAGERDVTLSSPVLIGQLTVLWGMVSHRIFFFKTFRTFLSVFMNFWEEKFFPILFLLVVTQLVP